MNILGAALIEAANILSQAPTIFSTAATILDQAPTIFSAAATILRAALAFQEVEEEWQVL